MTFNEALEKKAELKLKVHLDENDFLSVVPKKHGDLFKYLNAIRLQDATEKDAIRFSSDGKFGVCKIWTDGIIITHLVLC